MEVIMKKEYKLSIEYDDESDEVDKLTEVVSELCISEDEEVWLETGDGAIRLPLEIAEYIDKYGILGIA
jgi:hypothetical protein